MSIQTIKLLDELIDIVENKDNNNNNIKNCEIDLEKNARKKLCDLIKQSILNIYNFNLNDNQLDEYIFNQFSRSTHNRGDITLPCFKLSKLFKDNPHNIAKQIVIDLNNKINNNNNNIFSKINDINGRINVYLNIEYLSQIIPMILNSTNSYLSKLPSNGQRVMIEYSQPNTHKAFHVGHMRNVALGDCLVRLYEHCGYKTYAVNYYGDEGSHVAKCIWLLQKKIEEEKLDLNFIKKTVQNKGEWLGKIYTEANNMLSLSNYTKYPYPSVIVAKVISIKNNIVCVEYKLNKFATVICNGTDYNVGNLVPYIPIGGKYKGKIIQKKNINGTISSGIILSASELGIKLVDHDSSRIYLIDKYYLNAQIGDKLTELGKYPQYSNINDVVKLQEKYYLEQQNVLKKLENNDLKWVNLWNCTKKWSLDEFKDIYKWLGARFDYDFFESECSKESRDLVNEYYNRGIFVESNGAKGIHLTSEKLGFCMLLKSNGSGLYATKDLALARQKFDKFNIDTSIYVVDHSQSHHFKQVFATLKRMGYSQANKCYHLSYAFVSLPSGKMAGRKGKIILFNELKQKLSVEINKKYLNKKLNWSKNELNFAERAISVGSIRYGMLNHDNNREIIFDFDKWTLSTGNTGPYLMYQYARIKSIIRKNKNIQNIHTCNYSILQNDYEILNILFKISQFQKKIIQICNNKKPSILCDYLFNICKLFSQWYTKPKNSIKKCKNNKLKIARLQFVKAIANIIKTGIKLLGITPLERM